MKLIALLILSLSSTLAFGQNFSEEIAIIYNYKQKELLGVDKYYQRIDKFTEKIEGDTSKYFPLLRFELKRSGHNPFFYFNGAHILFSKSQKKSDRELAAQAINKCDFNEVDPEAYVFILNRLALDNIDVTTSAIKILQDEKFKFWVSGSGMGMTFDQGICLVYMLLPLKNTSYIDSLITKFPSVNITAQLSIMTTLWYTYSCKGDDFLKSVMTRQAVDKKVRDYAKDLMSIKFTQKDKEYGEDHEDEDLKKEPEVSRYYTLYLFTEDSYNDILFTTKLMRKEKKCR